MHSTYILLGECSMCDNKADVVFVRKGLFRDNVRTFCQKCAKKHEAIRNDVAFNFI